MGEQGLRRISHMMSLIAVLAVLLVCVRILFEGGAGAEYVGRKIAVSFFLICAITVVACFAIAYVRGSPEERKTLFAPPPEYAQLVQDWRKFVSAFQRGQR
jgi:hypothetical protein